MQKIRWGDMYRIFLFSFSILVSLQAEQSRSQDHFHVCTYVNWWPPNVDKLVQSCQIQGIQLEVLGLDEPWFGLSTRYLQLRKYLNTLQDDDIMLFIDGFDVLLLSDKQTILEKFLKMKIPFLMSVERCVPYPHETDCPTSFRHINIGTFIGYVGHIKKWLDDVDLTLEENDMLQIINHWNRDAEAKKFYHFDCYAEIFFPLNCLVNSDVVIDFQNKTFFVTETHSTPCLIHADGGAYSQFFNPFYDAFIKETKIKPDSYIIIKKEFYE